MDLGRIPGALWSISCTFETSPHPPMIDPRSTSTKMRNETTLIGPSTSVYEYHLRPGVYATNYLQALKE